jgi:hypothetical protein
MIETRPLIFGRPQGRAIIVNKRPRYFDNADPFEIASRLIANRDRRQRMAKRQVRVNSRRIAHRSSI